MEYLLPVVIALAVLLLLAVFIKLFTVFEHERGLLYRNGKFQRLLDPGRHWLIGSGYSLQKVDLRSRALSILGQEILSADNISLKVSLAVTYRIEDPYRAVNQVANFQESLYLMLQVELRDLVGAVPIDGLLASRQAIGGQLLERAAPRAEEIGLRLLSAGIKDIMFPGELKNLFAQVINARQEGLAALERARGESAALRNLANAARLMDDNPGLLQLRLIQVMGTGSGNTFVLKVPEAEALLDTAAGRQKPKSRGEVKAGD